MTNAPVRILLFLKINPLLFHHDRPPNHSGVDIQNIFPQQPDEEQLQRSDHENPDQHRHAARRESVPPDQFHDQIDQRDQQADPGGNEPQERGQTQSHLSIRGNGKHGCVIQAVKVIFGFPRPA